MKNQITLEPCAGLGNRILALVSTYKYAKETDSELTIVWKREEASYAKFQNLFKPLDGKIMVEEIVEMPLKRQPLQTLWGYLKKRKYKTGAIFLDCDKFGNEDSAHNVYRGRKYYSKATGLCCPIGHADFMCLHPSEVIDSMARDVWSRITDHTIGIHVRRTDHVLAIENSPMELFLETMDFCLKEDSEATFYVATDDQQVLSELTAKYPGKIINFSGPKSRNKEAGIQAAVIDMWSLSKCRKIYGSYGSTFSQCAALIGDVPLVVLKREEKIGSE